MSNASRREFLASAAAGSLVSLGDLSFVGGLPRVSAAEAALDPKVVRMRPEIEPLVRLIEETPRGKLLEVIASRLHKGLGYRELLAALLLAGVRNVQPRPAVGFKFHAVLVVNSAHLAALASGDQDRWLPIFWALDYFKSAQAQDVKEGDWTMAPVEESKVPTARKAKQALIAALDGWDEPAADAAVAGLARTAGGNEIYELFFRYGARDFRSIGHKAIFVANSWRTLQCIGWQYSEPVLRSLAYALQNHRGDPNPAKSDLAADRPWRENVERAGKLRADWLDGKPSAEATAEMLAVFRQGSPAEACDKAVELINKGTAPQSIWDGVFAGAGELLMRQPGIVSLHAATTTNALHFGHQASGNDDTRRMLLLQNAAFLPMFREAMKGRGKVGNDRIDQLEPADVKPGEGTVEAIFADVSRDKQAAARKTLAYLKEAKQAQPLLQAARQLVFLKGNDAHDYKFSSAVLEDYYHASPAWRDRLLAASMYLLNGSGQRDNGLVRRTRDALKG